jgi:hypothetical protein
MLVYPGKQFWITTFGEVTSLTLPQIISPEDVQKIGNLEYKVTSELNFPLEIKGQTISSKATEADIGEYTVKIEVLITGYKQITFEL